VVPQSDVLKTDSGRELLDIEEGQERRHRNDVPMYWGEEGDNPGKIVHPAGTAGHWLRHVLTGDAVWCRVQSDTALSSITAWFNMR